MAITLASGINATQNRVTLTEALTASPGDLFRIDNEVVEFGGYGRLTGGRLVSHSGKVVSFSRGVDGTTAATHTATTAVLRVADGLVSAVGAPDPFGTASAAPDLAAVLAEGNDTGGVGIVSVTSGATNADTSLAATSVDGNANSRTDAVASGTGNADAESFAESDDGGDATAKSTALAFGGGDATVQAQASADGNGGADADRIAQTVDGAATAITSATASGSGSAATTATATSDTGDASAQSIAQVTSGAGTAAAGISATHGANIAGVGAVADVTSARMGFFGITPVIRPEVPATPTEQDIVDALVALGLVTQAAP